MLWRHASLALVIALALTPTAFVHAEPFAYITNQGSHNVSVIDLASQKVVATVPVGRSPAGVVAHGDRIYVVNWIDDNVSVLEARSGLALGSIATGKNSRGFGAFIGAPVAP